MTPTQSIISVRPDSRAARRVQNYLARNGIEQTPDQRALSGGGQIVADLTVRQFRELREMSGVRAMRDQQAAMQMIGDFRAPPTDPRDALAKPNAQRRAASPAEDAVQIEPRFNPNEPNVFSREAMGVQFAHDMGITGEGVDLVILDTGLGQHSELKVERFDDAFTRAPEDPLHDGHGHGTHVAGTAVGSEYGVAPDASLLGVKVLPDSGPGSLSSIFKGIRRAAEWQRERGRPMVVSMSLGGIPLPPLFDPFVRAISWYTKRQDIQFVVAAGNSGDRFWSIGTPGTSSRAITVGSRDHNWTPGIEDDRVSSFSSRGGGALNRFFMGQRVDVSTTGRNVLSTFPGDRYMFASGTSMATPAAAGAYVLLRQFAQREFEAGRLGVDPAELSRKGLLMKVLVDSTVDDPEVSKADEGSGFVNIPRAFALLTERYSPEAVASKRASRNRRHSWRRRGPGRH